MNNEQDKTHDLHEHALDIRALRKEWNIAFSECPPRKPPLWRDLHEQVRAVFYHAALQEMASTMTLNVNLSFDILDPAHENGFLDYIRRRVALSLKRNLKRQVPFWFVIEDDDKGRSHIHGEIQLFDHELQTARKALRLAAGEWPPNTRQFQVKLQANPDENWALYATKNVHKATPGMRAWMGRYGLREGWVPTFDGKAMTATQDVRRDAERLYNEARQEILAARAILKAPPIELPAEPSHSSV